MALENLLTNVSRFAKKAVDTVGKAVEDAVTLEVPIPDEEESKKLEAYDDRRRTRFDARREQVRQQMEASPYHNTMKTMVKSAIQSKTLGEAIQTASDAALYNQANGGAIETKPLQKLLDTFGKTQDLSLLPSIAQQTMQLRTSTPTSEQQSKALQIKSQQFDVAKQAQEFKDKEAKKVAIQKYAGTSTKDLQRALIDNPANTEVSMAYADRAEQGKTISSVAKNIQKNKPVDKFANYNDAQLAEMGNAAAESEDGTFRDVVQDPYTQQYNPVMFTTKELDTEMRRRQTTPTASLQEFETASANIALYISDITKLSQQLHILGKEIPADITQDMATANVAPNMQVREGIYETIKNKLKDVVAFQQKATFLNDKDLGILSLKTGGNPNDVPKPESNKYIAGKLESLPEVVSPIFQPAATTYKETIDNILNDPTKQLMNFRLTPNPIDYLLPISKEKDTSNISSILPEALKKKLESNSLTPADKEEVKKIMIENSDKVQLEDGTTLSKKVQQQLVTNLAEKTIVQNIYRLEELDNPTVSTFITKALLKKPLSSMFKIDDYNPNAFHLRAAMYGKDKNGKYFEPAKILELVADASLMWGAINGKSNNDVADYRKEILQTIFPSENSYYTRKSMELSKELRLSDGAFIKSIIPKADPQESMAILYRSMHNAIYKANKYYDETKLFDSTIQDNLENFDVAKEQAGGLSSYLPASLLRFFKPELGKAAYARRAGVYMKPSADEAKAIVTHFRNKWEIDSEEPVGTLGQVVDYFSGTNRVEDKQYKDELLLKSGVNK